MKKSFSHIEEYRLYDPTVLYFSATRGELEGFFEIPNKGVILRCFATNGGGWEHVSVTIAKPVYNRGSIFRLDPVKKCPRWDEMCFVKDMFWDEEETVMQIHPPMSEYVSHHDYCLHLWKPIDTDIPLPSSELVGYRKKDEGISTHKGD